MTDSVTSKKTENQPTDGPTYKDSGVDIDAGAALVDAIGPLVKKTHRTGVMGGLGGFGGLFDLKASGFTDPILVAANDGVGTKLKIAIDTGFHETVGIDLVAMCVNDLIVQGAEPLFFLDYAATGKIDQAVLFDVISGIATGCEMAGCALIGGETAEMPGMYSGDDYDLAGFSVGAVERTKILPSANIKSGDKLIGLASDGLHSNGYSLIRHIVSEKGLDWLEKPTFGEARTLGEALLVPTRIYVKPLLNLLHNVAGIKGFAHITGGGLTENLPRILPDDVSAQIDLSAIPGQDVFTWLLKEQNLDESEMLKTFNCGVGMVIVVAKEHEQQALDLLNEQGEKAFALGSLIEGKKEVNYEGHLNATS